MTVRSKHRGHPMERLKKDGTFVWIYCDTKEPIYDLRTVNVFTDKKQ